MPPTSTAILSFLWIALTGLLVGGAVLRCCGRGFGPALRVMLALGVGLPILAYATLVLGLLGRLGHAQLIWLLAISGAVGLLLGWTAMEDLWCMVRRMYGALLRSRHRLLYWLLGLWALLLLPAALAPPAGEDWDGVAEHLAMAKVWLTSGAIRPLWYDHHSQFPATLQMLYVLGLGLGGPVAAKLVHTLFGLLTVASVGLLARRHFGRTVAPAAMIIMATTPLVGWLSTIAYVDLGPLFYTILGMSFFLDWVRPEPTPPVAGDRRPSLKGGHGGEPEPPSLQTTTASRLSPAVWAGVCLGLAMAMKMQSLLFFGIMVVGAVYLWWRRRSQPTPGDLRSPAPSRGQEGASPPRVSEEKKAANCAKISRITLGQIAAFFAVAVAIAGPWYVKSWLWTGNPVYPFAYGVFGGKQWSPAQAQRYTYEQKAWGWGELPPEEDYYKLPPLQRFFAGPRRPDHLLLAPFGLTFLPWDYVDKAMGKVGGTMLASVGPLYLALLPLLLLYRRRPWAWRVLAWAAVPVWLFFLFSAQYSRYLLPALGWTAAPAAWAAWRFSGTGSAARRLVSAALGVMLLFSYGGSVLRDMTAMQVLTGKVSVDDYLSLTLPPYRVERYLNQVMKPGDKVIAYGEPRLFYLDQPYLWGDPGYHRLLVYDKMKTAQDLVAAYRGLGIDYVLINPDYFQGATGENAQALGLLRSAVTEGELVQVPVVWPPSHYIVFTVKDAGGPAEQ